jgi:hypothetical protein
MKEADDRSSPDVQVLKLWLPSDEWDRNYENDGIQGFYSRRVRGPWAYLTLYQFNNLG